MATWFEDFSGELEWVYSDRPDEYMGNKFYKATVRLDKKSMEKFKELKKKGSKLTLKDGEKVTFRCPTEKNGTEYTIDVVQWDDKEKKYVPFTERLGNGSWGKVNVELYDYEYQGTKGVGHRLRSIAVTDYVPVPEKIAEGTTETGGDPQPWG